jgi:hypothetical protein
LIYKTTNCADKAAFHHMTEPGAIKTIRIKYPLSTISIDYASKGPACQAPCPGSILASECPCYATNKATSR